MNRYLVPDNLMRCIALLAGVSATVASASAQDAVAFTERDLSRIMQLSPLPDPPPNPTNRHADDPAAARLGQFLFFDQRLSSDGSVSCATCHDPGLAFTDGKTVSQGVGTVNRNAPTVLNSAYARWLFWDGRADSLWAQALQPLENDLEMGGDRVSVVRLIFSDEQLRSAYERIFGPLPDERVISRLPDRAKPLPDQPESEAHRAWSGMEEDDRRLIDRIYSNVGKALEAYERKLVSRRAPFDVFVEGLRSGDREKMAVLTPSAQRGLKLFVDKANCRLCHHGPNLSDDEFHYLGVPPNPQVAAVDSGRFDGLRRLRLDPFNAAGEYSDDPQGVKGRIIERLRTGPEFWGQQKTPSLRNVALTAPYMHQGQFATLWDVLYFDSTLEGAVPLSHHQEQIVKPLNLTDREMEDLIAFLVSLTDVSIEASLLNQPESPILDSTGP